jgi:hypothetical protein
MTRSALPVFIPGTVYATMVTNPFVSSRGA